MHTIGTISVYINCPNCMHSLEENDNARQGWLMSWSSCYITCISHSDGYLPLWVWRGILCSDKTSSRDTFQAILLEETRPRCNYWWMAVLYFAFSSKRFFFINLSNLMNLKTNVRHVTQRYISIENCCINNFLTFTHRLWNQKCLYNDILGNTLKEHLKEP